MNITELQLDVLRELINIGVGRAAETLNQMTSSHVALDIPQVQVKTVAQALVDCKSQLNDPVSVVKLGFDGLFSGLSVLYFAPDEAGKLVSLLLGEEPSAVEMDMLRAGTLQEVGNIVLNGVMGSVANMLKGHFSYLPPDHFETPFGELLQSESDKQAAILIARTSFTLEAHVIEGQVVILFDSTSFVNLLQAVDEMTANAGMTME